MSRELRICPGVGARKCGAFLSTLDRDPHPTCARCRGKICTRDMTCDFCADWSLAQWELFTKKRSYRERKKIRPSGSVPLAPKTSPRAETPSGVSQPGTSSSSFSRPSGGPDERGGLRVHLVVCPVRLPPLPLGLGLARGGGECLWMLVCCARARLRLFCSFGSWGGGGCSFAVDAPCPLCFLGCFSPFLTARSTTWGTERSFGGPLPRRILPWFLIFGSRSTEG